MRNRKQSGPDPLVTLEKEGLMPVYAVDGTYSLVQGFLQTVTEMAFPPGAMGKDFNFERLSGREAGVSVQRILDSAQTLPAFAPRRLIIVSQADAILPDRKDAVNEAFVQYAKKPSPTTTLVLVSEKWDARTKVYKAIQKHGRIARFEPPSERQLPQYIQRRAKHFGLRIDDDAVSALIRATGHDFEGLNAAIEKLSLFVGDRSASRADVDTVSPAVAEESIFALVEAIAEGRTADALQGVHHMMVGQREPALRLLAMVARQYRLLVKAKAGLSEGKNLASLLGVPPFSVDGFRSQARKMNFEQLAQALSDVAEADHRLKGGALDVEDIRIFESLLLGRLAADS